MKSTICLLFFTWNQLFVYFFAAPDDDDEDDIDETKSYVGLAMERVMRAADASLTVLNIMTSKKMPKPVYLGLFTKLLLHDYFD